MSLEGSTPLSQNPNGNTAAAFSDVNDISNILYHVKKSIYKNLIQLGCSNHFFFFNKSTILLIIVSSSLSKLSIFCAILNTSKVNVRLQLQQPIASLKNLTWCPVNFIVPENATGLNVNIEWEQ